MLSSAVYCLITCKCGPYLLMDYIFLYTKYPKIYSYMKVAFQIASMRTKTAFSIILLEASLVPFSQYSDTDF